VNVLVLGAYGVIGEGIVQALRARDFTAVGLGRSVAAAERRMPEVAWRQADIAGLLTTEDWLPFLDGIDLVVNASGALQDGGRDRLSDLQERAMRALWQACARANVRQVVQISAPGAVAEAPTAFLATKAAADRALRESGLDWLILKPGLVIAPAAWGGTALLRSLAALPWIVPLVHAEARLQSVALSEVAETVARAAAGEIPWRQDLELVEEQSHSLAETTAAFRAWLGFPKARAVVTLPGWTAAAAGRMADLLAQLGWRSPLRSTAMRTIRDGVHGDPAAWKGILGRAPMSLTESLASIPATPQERWFARLYLLKAVILGSLSLFWLLSGGIALVRLDAAAAVLSPALSPAPWLIATLAAASLWDCLLGIAILFYRWARPAAFGMLATSLVYLILASFFVPALWLDPLGPLVKVIPSLALTLAALAMLEER